MIYNRYLENDTRFGNVIEFFGKIFDLKNILFAVLSFALANVSFALDVTPFSYVLFGVASVFNVPLLLVLLFSILGLASTSLTTAVVVKLLAFFVLFSLLTALVNIQGVSKRFSVFFKFLIAISIIEVIFNFINSTLFTNIIGILSNIAIFSVLYFVFVSGIYVLINFNKGYVYTKEESVAMIAVVAIALTIFKDVQVLGFSVFNVLILTMILIFSWKKGPIYGGAAGLIIGLMLTLVMQVNMTYIVSLSLSGIISGVLSKFGKVAVAIGFLAGNIYLIYYANEFSYLSIRLSEFLVAAVPLLIIPKRLEIKLSSLFNKNKTLDKTYENVLDTASSIRKKVGAVSEVFDNLADSVVECTEEENSETRAVIKRYITEYTYNTCIDCKNKRECIADEKLNIIVDYIATKLENNEKIDSSMLTFECNESEKIIDGIYEIYNSMKLMRILKRKEKENSDKISKQYKEVSKILSNVAKNIKNVEIVKTKEQKKLAEELKFYGFVVYEENFVKTDNIVEYTFVTDILTDIDKQKKQIVNIATDILEQDMTIKLILNSSKTEKSKIKLVSTPAYETQTGICSLIKTGEDVSGDSYSTYELSDLKYISILSDGAGSGKEASSASTSVIAMLEKLLEGGFEEDKAIEIINSVIKLKGEDSSYSTLDTFIMDLKTANASFIKLGSAPTYVVEDSKVITINNMNIPIGLIEKTEYVPVAKKLKNNDLVIQISDGVVDDTQNINDNYFINYLKTVDVTKSARVISEDISRFLNRTFEGNFKDDITVLVTKVKKTNI